MTDFKHEERLSRQHAAERLADIAYALTAGETLELRAAGEQVRVPVAAEVLVRRESKSDGERVEVEVGLSWSASGEERESVGETGRLLPGPPVPGGTRNQDA